MLLPKVLDVPTAQLAGPILVPKTLLSWLILYYLEVFITFATVTTSAELQFSAKSPGTSHPTLQSSVNHS